MKKPKCKACKRHFEPSGRGRPPLFCTAACRQKAYRTREAKRSPALRALQSDLAAIRDKTARSRAAVAELERLGYEVTVTRRQTRPPPKKQRSTKLRLIKSPGEDSKVD